MTKRFLLGFLLVAISIHAETKSPVRFIDVDTETGSSRAVVIDENEPLVHTTQILPVDKTGEVIGKGNVKQQIGVALTKLDKILGDSAVGADLRAVVKLNVYAANDEVVAETERTMAKVFGKTPPAVTFVISKLANPDALVAMDAIALSTNPADTTVQRHHAAVFAKDEQFAQTAVLPKGGVVYISGQAIKGALPEATAKTLEQLEKTLTFLKLEKKDVVSAKAFVQPATEAAAVRAEFAKFFQGELVPPLSLVDWTSGKDLPIEIELVVAARGTGHDAKGNMSYLCPPFMTNSPVYSKIARVNSGKLIYLSGIVGKTPNNAEAEIHEIFADLKEITKKAGSDMNHLAKATYYVSNPQTSGKLNDIRPKYYNPKTPPAATKAMVRGVGFPAKGITFDMIAVTAE